MPARRVNSQYYQDGSAARQIVPDDIPIKRANTTKEKIFQAEIINEHNRYKEEKMLLWWHLYFVDLLCLLLLHIGLG